MNNYRIIIFLTFLLTCPAIGITQVAKDSLAILNKKQSDPELDSILRIMVSTKNEVIRKIDSILNENNLKEILHSSISKPLGWTSDFEHIFSAAQILELDSVIGKFEKETTNQIAIVTINSSWTTKEKFESLTLEIANNWGVGQVNKNNGILICISAGLKMIRIHNGYGIEKNITNRETKKIIDDIFIPNFILGNYYEGTRKGLLAIIKKSR